jgi:hypothetical protein
MDPTAARYVERVVNDERSGSSLIWTTASEADFLHEYKHLPRVLPENLIGAPHAAFQ